MVMPVFRSVATAIVGKKLAERYGAGAKGALIGALAPVIVRRAFTPLGLVVGGAFLAKKLYDIGKHELAEDEAARTAPRSLPAPARTVPVAEAEPPR